MSIGNNENKLSYDHYAILLDKSGSMFDCKNSILTNLASFVEKQKKVSMVDSIISITTFNNNVERVVGVLETLPSFNYEPSGNTALYDAVSSTIADIKSSLSLSLSLSNGRHPDNIYVIIVTDGYDNCSWNSNQHGIKSEIASLEAEWKFAFLGANQNARVSGQKLGISSCSCLDFTQTESGIAEAFNAITNSIRRQKISGRDVLMFDDYERCMSAV